MIKNALLSIKKSIGHTILLFVLMVVIANLVMAGLSIKAATSTSMKQVRSSLGSDVTLSYNIQSMMKNREKGTAMDQSLKSITTDMANQLVNLKYVKSHNYTVNIGVTSDDIQPVETTTSEAQSNTVQRENDLPQMMDSSDFTVVGNTTMANLSDFTEDNYVLKSGRLLTEKDANTQNCVIETNLASDNDLDIGDTLTFIATNSDGVQTNTTVTIVGIYEIKTVSQMGGMMSNRQNPMNYIYTDLSVAQTLNGSTTELTSATYSLDDPEHIDEFKELATATNIDFETYTLNANDQVYQRSISSLENMEQFADIFLWVVVGAGSAILCLILILTMRGRFYEIGVFLSLGQSKFKIVLQQLFEILIIAAVAFSISLGTGKMVSNVVSTMLESNQAASNQMVMEIPNESNKQAEQDNTTKSRDFFSAAVQTPATPELDVSLTTSTIIQVAEITGLICLVSVLLPSIYILRMSPREILIKKEG